MKKVLVLLALLAAVCGLLTFSAAAESAVASGICGENLTWTLDAAGTLTVSGTGAMEDYNYNYNYNYYYKVAPWYQSRDSIQVVVIESGVTSIGDSAFWGCSSLTSITIPESVTTIGGSAFSYCSNLTSITLPQGLTAIGRSAFSDCSSLTGITLPESVTAIGEDAFSGCSSLISITIPEGVTAIGEYAFYWCSSLTGITIPEGVTTIGEDAFEDCTSLSSITIPESVTTIGGGAFYGCSSLTDVSITDLDAWCRIDFGNGSATPMCYGKNIRLDGQKIVSVTVPEGATEVKAYTFCGFRDLIQVTIPKSVTTIGDSAFDWCTSLTSINIPESVTAIGDSAFRSCDSLTSINIPESVTSIGSGAFEYCSSLTDVSITDLEAWCRIDFANDSATPMRYAKNIWLDGQKLVSVTVPEGVTEVKAYTFCGFKDLIQVTIPKSVTTIGDCAFSGCSSLTSINIPESVTSIGEYAFYDCSSLTGITIPEGVTAIDNYAFFLCYSLTDVSITDLAAWCNIAFVNEEANPLYKAENLYLNGELVETLEIPEGVTVIQPNVFRGATCIQRVALPKGLKGVAANAFYGCRNIQEVFYAGSEAEWKALPIAAGNDPLKNATIYFNSTIDDYYCRITVEVSEGGRVAVSANTAKAGDTVTVTATPYRGYVMSAIYVDGAEISGDTFTVTGNHRVSAVFTRLPIVGGNEDFRLEGITVLDGAGNPLQELPAERLLVTVTVRHLKESGSGAVMLAQYDEKGRYQGLLWLTLEEMPQDMTLKVTLPVDNTGGSIAQLKVFLVESLFSPAPVGEAISFGTI